MTFTARIVKKDVSPTIKAIVDVTADGSLAIHGLKLIEGKNGLFLSMPADKWKDTSTGETKHIDIVHPTNADTRAELFKAVKDAYEQSQTQSSAAPMVLIWSRIRGDVVADIQTVSNQISPKTLF